MSDRGKSQSARALMSKYYNFHTVVPLLANKSKDQVTPDKRMNTLNSY